MAAPLIGGLILRAVLGVVWIAIGVIFAYLLWKLAGLLDVYTRRMKG
jgi:hypothetical protein